MDLKILEERPNPLLQRTEYRFRAEHATAATPTRETVRVELSKLLKVPKDRLVVERMNARFGTAVTEGVAVTYQSIEARDRLVREHILIRNKIKEKAAATPPGGTPAIEAPAAPPAAPAEKPKAYGSTMAKARVGLYGTKGDTLSRTHKSCPKCGPGTFLAEHADRRSCGRCGYMESKPKDMNAPPPPAAVARPPKPAKPKAPKPAAPAATTPAAPAAPAAPKPSK